MNYKLLFLLLFCMASIFGQRSGKIVQAKEWRKNGSLFGAKSFIFKEVLGTTKEVQKFAIIPLFAASSDELTTVFYNSTDLNKTGLVFCFYGSYMNQAGVLYKGYDYKHLPKNKALLLLDKIEKTIDLNKDFLKDEKNINNIFFEFEDLNILIYSDGGIKMRVYWQSFDSTWEQRAFYWTKKRFEREL